MTKDEYQAYLRSPQWQGTRKRALWRAQNRCQSPICRYDYVRAFTDGDISEHLWKGEYRLDVHHLSYERLGNELPDDLMVLCRDCHDLIHGKKLLNLEDEDQRVYAAIYARLRGKVA